MSEVGAPPFKKPRLTFIQPPDVGGRYEIAVATLVAAKLAIDPQVEDYHIFTNLKPVEPFDDVVARVLFKGDNTPHVYVIQVKHVNRGEKKLDVSKYLNGYIKMSNSEQFKEAMSGIPVNNSYFCYFCIKQPQNITKGYTTIQHSSANDSKESALSFENCYKLTCDGPRTEIEQKFLDQFYLYFDQPNIEAVDDQIKGICKINDTKDILYFVDHFVTNKELQLNGLCKTIFESELLRIRLGDNIVPPPNIIQLNDSPIVIWNELTLLHNVTIVKAEPKIEESLFGCLAQMLNRILNNTIDWKEHRTNALDSNSTVINEFKQLFIAKDSVKTRHWIDPPNTLKSLIIELWKSGRVPLILRSNDDLPALKDYAHLNKNYIIITDNLVAKRKECEGYHLTTFTHVSDIKCFAVRDELLQSISVSLQGREPIPLYSIVNDHEPLIATLSCSCILHLIKARTAYLSKDYVDGDHHDNMIFLIEDPTVSVEYDIGDISRGTQNIAIRCRPEKIVECREKIKQNFNFSKEIYRCSASSEIENFSLIEGNKSPLRDFFVDQDGENVYNLGDNIVPILGCSLQNVQQNYISRFLRSAVVLKSLFDSQTKGICFFSGDLNNLDKNIKINVVKILLDKIEEKVQQLSSKNVFIDIGNEDINKYWEKASTFKRPLLHIRVDYDTGMQLCRYSDWKGLSDYISFSGREISEDNFLTKITGGITLVTGEPGIGKSSLLKSLFKDHGMEKYILFYNLVDYEVESKHKPSEPDYALNLLLSKFKNLPCSEFLSELFKRKERLLVLLDSFDEVLPSRKEDTLDFIRNLAANNFQIIIASRVIANYILMENFEANIFKVDILRADVQKKYIRNSNLSKEMLANIPVEFLQNPLYLAFIKIISENNEHLVGITRFKLYEKIIEIKLNQYLHKYFSKDHQFDQEYLLTYIQKLHQKLALTRILDPLIVENLLNWKYEERYIQPLKLGIVMSVDENSYPTFVHETFAEYLTADWLIKNKTKSVAKVIYQELLKQKKLHVLDILCEHLVLHKAVLDKDYEKIKVYARKHSHLEKTDELGRTALHVAAAYYKENLYFGIHYNKRFHFSRGILDEIIHNMCELKVSYSSSDFLMQWDWVQHLNCGNRISLEKLDNLSIFLREAYLNYIIQKLRHGVELCILRDPKIESVYMNALRIYKINIIRNLLFVEDVLFNGLSQASKHLEYQRLEIDALNISKINGFTPLHVACIYGNVEVVRTLINLNYDTNATDNFGCTPLHYGVINPFEVGTEMTKLLLENGSQTDIQNERGVSPTIMAIQSGNIDTAELLLKKCTLDPLKLHILLLCEKYANRKRQFAARLPLPTVVPKGYFCRLVKLLLDRDINVDEFCESDEYVISRGAVNKEESYSGPDKKNTAFMRAVEAGNAEIIELLLERGINVDSTTADDRTPLIVALECEWENSDCVKLLLERGANVNSTVDGKTPLIFALESKFEKSNSVKLLLEGGANVNSTTSDDKIPLLLALESSWVNLDCINLLLEKGANVNSTTRDGKTPLMFAVEYQWRSLDPIKFIVDRGANVNSETTDGETPLMFALESEWKNFDCINLLLERGANVNSETTDGKTPLMFILESERENFNCINLLLERGANVNSTTTDGKTPLMFALEAEWVNYNYINFLLERGADVNSTTTDGKTPLMFGLESSWEKLDCISLLLERKADVNSTTIDGKTPLMFALESWWVNLDCIKLLIQKEANVNSTTADGRTPLMLALEFEWENLDCINLLLRREADVNSTTIDGKTPLMFALESKWKNLNCIKLLLERGANVNSATIGGKTPLILALESDWENLHCINLLLEKGANVNSTTTDGKTPLIFALESERRNLSSVNLLLERGADVKSTTIDGKTPLMLALEYELKNSNCVKSLLQRRTDVDSLPTDIKMRLMFDLKNECKNIGHVKLLLEKGADINSITDDKMFLIFASTYNTLLYDMKWRSRSTYT